MERWIHSRSRRLQHAGQHGVVRQLPVRDRGRGELALRVLAVPGDCAVLPGVPSEHYVLSMAPLWLTLWIHPYGVSDATLEIRRVNADLPCGCTDATHCRDTQCVCSDGFFGSACTKCRDACGVIHGSTLWPVWYALSSPCGAKTRPLP